MERSGGPLRCTLLFCRASLPGCSLSMFGGAILLCALTTVAFAQNTALPPATVQPQSPPVHQGESNQLEEVVVTAQFRSENLQTTPLAITAVSAADLEDRSYTSVLDVAQSAPNVVMTQGTGGFGATNFAFIRGIGQPDFSFAFEPRVGFYIDDVYYATTFGSIFDLLDLDRVEIERGPQGVLNGRNSVGGAIRLFSQQPKGDDSGYIEVTGGNYDRIDVKGVYDMSLIPETVFLRISAGEEHRDGYVERENFACEYPSLAGNLPNIGTGGVSSKGCQTGTLGGIERYSGKLQLRILINDKIQDDISGDFTDDLSEAGPDDLLAVSPTYVAGLPGSYTSIPGTNTLATVPAGTPNGLGLWLANQGKNYYGLVNSPALLAALLSSPYRSYAIFGNPGLSDKALQITTPAVNHVKPMGVSNVLNIDLPDDIHFKSITAYRNYTGQFGDSQSNIALPLQEVYNEVAHHQFSQEGRFLGTAFDRRLEWTVGAFYLTTYSLNRGVIDDEGFSIYAYGLGEIPFVFYKTVNDSTTLTNVSGYGNGVLHITDQLSLTAGVRYTHETKDFDYDEIEMGMPPFIATAPSTTTSRADPRVALQYQFTPTVLGYASYSTGFTGGGYNPRPFAPQDIKIPLLTETVSAYELGLKSELFDHHLRMNLAGYYTTYKNIQLALSGCTSGCPTDSPFYYGNGGNARIYGFESEIEARPIAGLSINGSTGYTNFRYTKLSPYVNPDNDPTNLTLGSHEPYAPTWTANLGVQYEIGLGEIGSLTPRLDWSYRSTIYFGSDNNDPYARQGSYGLANGRLTYQPRSAQWSMAFFVTNLANKLYFTSRTDYLNSFGEATGTIGAPREFGVTLHHSFGAKL
jgi:iron complex outermembrane recepter protein